MRATIRLESSGLGHNLLNGIRLLFFRAPTASGFHYSLHQVVLLVAVGVLVSMLVDYLRYLPNPQFNFNALSGETLSLAGVLFVAYLVAVSVRDRETGLRFLVQGYSMAPFFYVIGVLLREIRTLSPLAGIGTQWVVYGISMLWLLGVVGFILHTVSGRRLLRTGLYLASYVAVVVFPTSFLWTGDYWYPRWDEDSTSVYDNINQEDLYYAQPGLVEAATRGLAPGRAGITDLYFVGFGGYASEDVFMKEVRFAQSVFDERFDTQGRSIALINNPATIYDIPLATASNLAQVLEDVGRIMNPEEDVLFLFMTSHGSQKHELAVNFRPLTLNDITPDDLKAALDAAGIKWRVLMISACYSGGFVEPLQDDYTLIATASASGKQSFGCGSESEFTYFGKAVLDDQFKAERYFPAAFEKAAEAIKAREAAERKEASDPRLFIGAAIVPILHKLAARLAAGSTVVAAGRVTTNVSD
jgi:hypothetical protein